jgi:prepilin-type processing-associated H-X9-DG protein
MRSSGFGNENRFTSHGGFTIVELCVVMGVIGALASMLLPTVFKAKSGGQSLSCITNLKQLQVGALMYADDHNDVLPPNNWRGVEWSDGCPQGFPATSGAWVLGNTTTDNGWGIQNGVLFPYINEMGAYHCPADKSRVDNNRSVRRKRSYSASFYMNGNTNKFDPQVKGKASEIRQPSKAFVFLDEHENSIDDGVFFFHSPGDPGEQSIAKENPENHFGGAHWMNMPADRHDQGCNLSFADGHVDHWRWLWPKKFASPDDDRDIANARDFKDYQKLQGGIPEVGSDPSCQFILYQPANSN